MKKAILFLSPVVLLLLLESCQALHRDIPKANGHYKRRQLTAFDEKELPADKAARVLLREETVAEVVAPEQTVAETVQPAMIVSAEQSPVSPEVVTVQRVVDVPQGDTLTGEEDIEELDEAVLEEAYESERIARSAYRFSFLPAFSLIFFPLLFVGVIGTLTQLARFKRFEYVTEAALDYEERARRTLIISIVVPILAILLLVLLILVLF